MELSVEEDLRRLTSCSPNSKYKFVAVASAKLFNLYFTATTKHISKVNHCPFLGNFNLLKFRIEFLKSWIAFSFLPLEGRGAL